MMHLFSPRNGWVWPALLVLLAGCGRDAVDEAAWQASRHGTAAGEGHGGRDLTGLEAGTRITEQFYYVAKYKATQEQKQIAQAAGTRAAVAVKKTKHAGVPPRYLAVRTRSDARAKTKTSVMIWDTESREIVGNNVYDLNQAPPTGALVKFETYSAEYVAAGE